MSDRGALDVPMAWYGSDESPTTVTYIDSTYAPQCDDCESEEVAEMFGGDPIGEDPLLDDYSVTPVDWQGDGWYCLECGKQLEAFDD